VTHAKAKVYALLALLFLLGGTLGASLAYAYAQREFVTMMMGDKRDIRERRQLRALTKTLALSDSQQTQVKAIFRKHAHLRRKLSAEMFERCGAPLHAHRAQVDAEIRAQLNPAQAKQFDQLVAKHRQEFLFRKRHEH